MKKEYAIFRTVQEGEGIAKRTTHTERVTRWRTDRKKTRSIGIRMMRNDRTATFQLRSRLRDEQPAQPREATQATAPYVVPCLPAAASQ